MLSMWGIVYQMSMITFLMFSKNFSSGCGLSTRFTILPQYLQIPPVLLIPLFGASSEVFSSD